MKSLSTLYPVVFIILLPFLCAESLTTNGSNCLLFQKLEYQPSNKNLLHPPLIPPNAQLFYSSNTSEILIFSPNSEYVLVAKLSFSSTVLEYQQFNHTFLTDVDRFNGLYSQFSEQYPLLFKLLRGPHDKIEVYSMQPKYSNSGYLRDYQWRREAGFSVNCPKYRDEASVIIIEIDGKLQILMTGGVSDVGFFDDSWLFSLETKEWRQIKGNLPSIKGHSVVFLGSNERFRSKVAIFGGSQSGKATNALYVGEIYESSGELLLQLKEMPFSHKEDIPLAREGHVAFMFRETMLIYGGCDYDLQTCFSDVFSIDLSEKETGFLAKWSKINETMSSIAPKPRETTLFLAWESRKTVFIFNGCDARGVCFKDAFVGRLYRGCLDNICPENAFSYKGKCRCYPGYYGTNCSLKGKECPHNCRNNGECLSNGTCLCDDGFFGPFCQYEFCRDQCNGHGYCDHERMTCQCESDFFGVNCKGNCVKNCNGNGYCQNGNCQCFPGFSGGKCEERKGFEGCWSFTDIEEDMIRKVCLAFDRVDARLTGFFRDHTKEYIFQQTKTHPKESPFVSFSQPYSPSSSTEEIIEGKLYKYQEESQIYAYEKKIYLSLSALTHVLTIQLFSIDSLSSETLIGRYQQQCESQRDCFGNGYCSSEGTCQCSVHSSGSFCQFIVQNLPVLDNRCFEQCRGNGICNETSGECKCYPGFSGPDCKLICPKNCSNGGVCDYSSGKCMCKMGYYGESCEKRLFCPGNCSNGGVCSFEGNNSAVCRCFEGYFGKDCSRSCPKNCSKRGVCDETTGKCQCYKIYRGEICENYRECEYNCSGRGYCEKGSCKCEFGFAGAACEFEVSCPMDCNGNGQCIWGKCRCEEGFEGRGCERSNPLYEISGRKYQISGYREAFLKMGENMTSGEKKNTTIAMKNNSGFNETGDRVSRGVSKMGDDKNTTIVVRNNSGMNGTVVGNGSKEGKTEKNEQEKKRNGQFKAKIGKLKDQNGQEKEAIEYNIGKHGYIEENEHKGLLKEGDGDINDQEKNTHIEEENMLNEEENNGQIGDKTNPIEYSSGELLRAPLKNIGKTIRYSGMNERELNMFPTSDEKREVFSFRGLQNNQDLSLEESNANVKYEEKEDLSFLWGLGFVGVAVLFIINNLKRPEK